MATTTTTTTTTPNHADLYDWNLVKSVEKYVRDTGLGDSYPLVFEDSQFDPDSSDSNPDSVNRWIDFEWVSFGATVFSLSTFHVRFFSRTADDRFGRERELMIGRVRNIMENTTPGITFLDMMGTPANPPAIQYNGADLKMAIRFVDRSATMDANVTMGEQSSQISGVHLVVVSYNVHVARPNALW